MILKENRLILNGVLIFSILSLTIAYFIQYALGHKPCNLCLIERIPYIASVILISLIFIINKFEKIISIIILLLLMNLKKLLQAHTQHQHKQIHMELLVLMAIQLMVLLIAIQRVVKRIICLNLVIQIQLYYLKISRQMVFHIMQNSYMTA